MNQGLKVDAPADMPVVPPDMMPFFKELDDTTADENTKTEAANQAAEISQNIVTETNIENLVKSKGFVDCVAFIQNGACNVVVQKDGEFASADAIAIKDIVVAQAKISADKITIVSK